MLLLLLLLLMLLLLLRARGEFQLALHDFNCGGSRRE